MRLPVSLNDTTCTITDTASSTNNPPITARTISCLVATATAPIMPPSASEPVSPMKIEAGGALNQRKPKPAPSTAPSPRGAGIAHEDRGRRRIEPEKAQAGAEHGAAQHRKLPGAGDVVNLQIVGEHGAAGEVGDHAEARRRDHHRNDGKAVETVGEVHRIAGADDDEGGKEYEEQTEVEHHVLEKRKYQSHRDLALAEVDQGDAGERGDQGFDAEPRARRKAVGALLLDLQIIVIEADKTEAERDAEHAP